MFGKPSYTSKPVVVIALESLHERELFLLWMHGYSVGAEIDRRGLGQRG